MSGRARGRPLPFSEVLADVRANLEMLEKCPGPHNFQKIDDGKTFGAKWRCTACDGVVDSVGFVWYTRGLFHGARVCEPKS
jgi:hypothetical protein